MFIEPIATEDANVKNELILPNIDFLQTSDETFRTTGMSLEKSVYRNRVSVFIEAAHIVGPDGRGSGWDNLEVGGKWEAYVNADHEFALSPMIALQLPTASDVAERETAVHPMLLVAKGMGDVHVNWLRPFAVQGDVGYERPTNGSRRTVNYDAVLMYSFPYLNDFVRFANAGYELEDSLRTGLSWGSLWGNLHPFVELNAVKTDGSDGERATTLRSGAAWMGKYVQVTVAANRRADPGVSHWGATVLVDWFLDEIFPRLASWPGGGHAHAP